MLLLLKNVNIQLDFFLELKADCFATDRKGKVLCIVVFGKIQLNIFRLIHHFNKDIINIPDSFFKTNKLCCIYGQKDFSYRDAWWRCISK